MVIAGALKATSNCGLQPAMDHILEHEGQPIPDLSVISPSGPSAGPAGGEDDEDEEAIRAVYGSGGGGNVSAEARVGFDHCTL